MITEGNIREIYDITGLTPLAGGYEFTFPYTSAQDVRVYTTGNRTDTEVSTSNYTIDESGATPKVVFIAGYSFPAGQTKLTIIRNVSYSQKLDLRNGDLIDADKLEGALDNITQQIQQVAEKVDRAILSSVSDTEPLSIPEASQRNNMLLGFDSEGKAIPVLTTDIEQKLAQALAAEESAITAKNAAENAQHEAESAQSAAETAQGKAETAQAAAESAEASSQTLLASIETKTEESIASINTTKTGAVGAVTTQQATSVAAVQAAQNTAESDIAGKRSSALTAIDTAKTTAVAAVNTQKETSVAAADREIVAKRDSALTDIQTARTNAVNAITTKKDQSLQEVEQLASERKAEINSLAANQKADVKQYTDSVVASAKTEIDTEKTTAVTAVQEEGDAKVAIIGSSGDAEVTRVQSVYQTDLNELKGDLTELTYFEHTPVFNDQYVGWHADKYGKISRNNAYNLSNPIELPLFVKKVIIKGKENKTINPYVYTAFLYPSTELKRNDYVYGGVCSNNGVLELEVPLNVRFLYLSDNNAESGYDGSDAYDVLFECSITDDSWYKNIKEELNADTNFIAKINEGCVERINQFDNLVWNQNKVIFSDGRIEDLNGYSCTGNIEIRKGDKITITSKDGSSSNVARLSKWTSYGTFEKVLELATLELTTIEYTATEDVEYVRLCKQDNNNFDAYIPGVKGGIYLERYIDKKINNIPSDEPLVDISMFSNIAVCGDSYTTGALFSDSTTVQGDFESVSWGKDLERISGVNVSVCASGGADVKLYQERLNCLPKILAEDPKELYFICLGINDSSSYVDKRGTIEDVKENYNDNPDTFYGNYGKIIAQIKEHAPKAKIILCKTWLVPCKQSSWANIYQYSSTAIEELANHFGIQYIETKDDVFFTSDFFIDSHVNHPIEATYSGMAKRVKYLIEKNIQENYLYYRDYGFTN